MADPTGVSALEGYPRWGALDDPLRSLPKISLHDHLDGSLRPATVRALGARNRFFTIPLRMYQAAPIEPRSVPLIFETPMRGW